MKISLLILKNTMDLSMLTSYPTMRYESKLQEKLVDVLEALQLAKFQWQWVELRLLLNELALIEKTADT